MRSLADVTGSRVSCLSVWARSGVQVGDLVCVLLSQFTEACPVHVVGVSPASQALYGSLSVSVRHITDCANQLV